MQTCRIAIIFVLLLLVSALTGMWICAADPMIQLLKLAGRLEHIEDDDIRALEVKKIVAFGFTWVALGGAPVGWFCRRYGPRLTGSTGILLQAAGLCLLFFTGGVVPMRIGAMLMGLSYQCIRNGHICAGAFFPKQKATVLALFGAACTFSLYLPLAILKFSSSMSDVKECLMMYFAFVLVPAFGVEVSVLPCKEFVAPPAVEDAEEAESLLGHTDDDPEKYETEGRPSRRSPPSVVDQICSKAYISFALIFTVSYFRNKSYPQNIRDALHQLFSDKEVVDDIVGLFNKLVPLSIVPMLIFGMLSDYFGIGIIVAIHTVLGVAWTFLITRAHATSQYVGALLYILNASFLPSSGYAFLASAFGLRSLPFLQGLLSTVSGLFALGLDEIWNVIIVNKLCGGEYVRSNQMLFLMSMVIIIPAAGLVSGGGESGKGK